MRDFGIKRKKRKNRMNKALGFIFLEIYANKYLKSTY